MAVHALVFALAIPVQLLIEADALTFHRMAVQFLETGGFVEQQRQPLYPIAMAGALRIGGERGLDLLIAVQVLASYLTGAMAWRMSRQWLTEVGAAAVFALVILNPSAVALAHWPLADTLHALLFTASVWALLGFARDTQMWQAAATGLAIGLAALTRPEAQFLLYVLPLALPLAAIVTVPGRLRSPLVLTSGCVAATLAIAVSLPWVLQVRGAGDAFVLSSAAKTLENVRGHFALIEAARTGEAQAVVIDRLMAEEPTDGLTPEHYIRRIFSSDPKILVNLFATAWLAQFASGGGQSLNRLLDVAFDRPDKILNQPDPISEFFSTLRGQSLAGVSITLLTVGFAVVLRAFGLVGLVVLVARKYWVLVLVIVALLAFKGGVHLFYGLARYRLSVEPLLMMLAVFGWQGLRSTKLGFR